MKNLAFPVLLLLISVLTSAQGHYHQRPIREHAAHTNTITAGGSLGGVHGELAAGLHFDYEHFLDKGGQFSLALPLNYYVAGTIGEAHEGDTRHNMHGLHIAPGLRFHPAGNYHRVDLSIGAAMLLGGCNDNVTYINGVTDPVTHHSGTSAGLLAGLYLNFYPGPTAVMGFHIEAGTMLSPTFQQGGLILAGIHFGGRF